MPATRKLLLLAVFFYVLLPLPWVLWRPVGLFYNFDLELLPRIAAAIAVFGVGWMIGEALRPHGGWFAIAPRRTDQHRWPIGTTAIVAALVCSLVVNILLSSMGALTIDENTGLLRVPVLTTLGSAHIFALIYSGCLLFRSKPGRSTRVTLFLAAASIVATIIVGVIENRRLAVLLPLLVYVVLAFITGRTQVLRKLLLTVPVFLALFAITTYVRIGGGNDAQFNETGVIIAGDAVVGRLGSALLLLDPVFTHLATERTPFDPHTLRSIFSDLPNLGLVAPPFEHGYGNEFGRQLGLLPPDNETVGINSGWIGELLLLGGFPAVLMGGVILGSLAASCWHLLSASHPAGLFLRVMVAIFIVSGFQMEVAFPIASLLRAALIAILLAAAEWYLGNKFRPT